MPTASTNLVSRTVVRGSSDGGLGW